VKTECPYNKTESLCLAVSVSILWTSGWGVYIISSKIHRCLLRFDTARSCRFLPTFRARFSPEHEGNTYLRNDSVNWKFFTLEVL